VSEALCYDFTSEVHLQGYVDDLSCTVISLHENIICVSDAAIGHLLARASGVTRLAGLSLLVSSTHPTTPLNETTLTCLRRNIPHLYTDADINFRGSVRSFTQVLLDRLRAASSHLARSYGRPEASEVRRSAHSSINTDKENSPAMSITKKLHEYKGFLQWFLNFLSFELCPTSSYQRHISSLRGLNILVRSGLDPAVHKSHLSKRASSDIHWPFQVQVITPVFRRALFDLLLDAFDDVRREAMTLVEMTTCSFLAEMHSVETVNRSRYQAGLEVHSRANEVTETNSETLLRAVQRAQNMVRGSHRVDHADGWARLYSILPHQPSELVPPVAILPNNWQSSHTVIITTLVTSIEEANVIAVKQFSAAVSQYPIHGLFVALRFVLHVKKSSSIYMLIHIDTCSKMLSAYFQPRKPVVPIMACYEVV